MDKEKIKNLVAMFLCIIIYVCFILFSAAVVVRADDNIFTNAYNIWKYTFFPTFWKNAVTGKIGEDFYDFLHENEENMSEAWQPEVSDNWEKDPETGEYTSFTIPETYDFYGKRLLRYDTVPNSSLTWELFTCHFVYTTPVNEDSGEKAAAALKYNYMELTRENSMGVKQSRTIYIEKLRRVYYGGDRSGSRDAYTVRFEIDYINPANNSHLTSCSLMFVGLAENDISLSVTRVPNDSEWYTFNYGEPNGLSNRLYAFALSMGTTNNTDCYNSVADNYSLNNYGTIPVLINPTIAGAVVNVDSLSLFGELGFHLDPDLGITLDPELFGQYYESNIADNLEDLIGTIFSNMPEIGDTFVNPSSENTYNYLDFFKSEEPSTTGGTGGGGVPESWLGSYSGLDTSPDIDVNDPDYQYFVDNAVSSSPSSSITFFRMASDFIVNNGFFPILCAIIILTIFWRFTGGD